jgi:Zn-finger nucleic acid-binding protein
MTSMNSPLMKSINPIVEVFYPHRMTSDAATLHCPNCGAPAPPGEQTCKYCHATLATVSCPSCFALMFAEAAYCPHCGARRARADGSAAQAPCPACRGRMTEVQVGDTALLECGRCHGMWIDAATFEHVCASREAQAAVLHQWPSAARPVAAGEVKYRPCVACGKMMNRMNFGRLSGTIVDLCKGHGTFLDAGELHLIAAFIQGGGLDRARQRQIEDLKEEEQRLRSAQRHPEGPRDQNFEVSRTWSGYDLIALLARLKDS